ncbi:uncharacterized protein LDX57_001113 [Aspergillus melleus]|uniref:uncharacterized protein n=1 Tax=Aspergillus melleus TaxID=138277 RepID=UPI001E8EB975|nr:uncharacterized protein LDX57_001113 [Aspergillus melleus]KAH8423355.1 hypothetical protein LDX57_001113 [Aspergillus melleus]
MSRHNHIHHYSNPAYVQNAAVHIDYGDNSNDDPAYPPPAGRPRTRPRYYEEPMYLSIRLYLIADPY